MSRGVRASQNTIEVVNSHIISVFRHPQDAACPRQKAPPSVLHDEAGKEHQAWQGYLAVAQKYVVTNKAG